MSKGHMEALAALKARRAQAVTKLQRVTKPAPAVSVTAAKGGRPKVHTSAADKQKAYRDRKKAKA